jgi:predicted dehydrogenase/threonine dehydrogenase-like Zn-dependent dehydrogenase
MRQILMNMNGAVVARMPRPVVQPGSVLIRVRYSFLSIGTEIAPLRSASVAGAPDMTSIERNAERARLLRHYLRASLRDPRKAVRRLSQIAERRLGSLSAPAPVDAAPGATVAITSDVNAQGWAVGYSAAGEVVDVGQGVVEFASGDLVVAAGAGQANHADFVSVPRNLVCRVPAGCDLKEAASATIGAIAMQGVRRAAPQLGERVCVLGLGLIGQITVQLLRAAGCRVIGLDLDATRVERAIALGLNAGAVDVESLKTTVRDVTNGRGADRTLITAATKSDAVINLAMEVTRAKGTVVIVGDVGLNVDRAAFYRKEVDLLMSTSYGPGRYDPTYEANGVDYPFGYVRWTLNRNMQSYLEFLASGAVRVMPLIDRVVPIDQAPAVYAELTKADGPLPLGVVIEYPDAGDSDATAIVLKGHRSPPIDRINYALVGAGSFGVSMLVPQMKKRKDRFFLRGVVSRRGTQGSNFARENQVEVLTADLDDVLRNPEFHLIVIATRHSDHASQVIRALKAGKHVFVEKPLALTWAELSDVVAAYESQTDRPLLLVGFNRRFSPAVQALKAQVSARRAPLVIEYRLNAGYLPPDHWVHGPDGGGRNIGEACHMYDVFRFLVGAPVRSVTATSIDPGTLPYNRNDNFSATIGYEDGSLATLVYTALGPKTGMGKEHLTVFCDGDAFVVDDYRKLTRTGDGTVLWQNGEADKGHLQELSAFGDAIAAAGIGPISFEELVETTAVSLQVEDLLFGRGSEHAQ